MNLEDADRGMFHFAKPRSRGDEPGNEAALKAGFHKTPLTRG